MLKFACYLIVGWRFGTVMLSGEFGKLWISQALTDMGTAVTLVALPLSAIQLGASTFQVALLSSLASAGWLIMALPAGAIADRVSLQTLMLICLMFRVIVVLLFVIVAEVGQATVLLMLLTGFALSVIVVFFDVAAQSIVPGLLPPSALVSGNSALFTTNSIAAVAGPSVAAIVILAVGSANRAVAVDCVIATIAACVVSRLSRRANPVKKDREGSFLMEIRRGFGAVLDDRAMRRIVVCGASSNFFTGMVMAIITVFLVRDLTVNPGTTAFVIGVGAAGGILGGIVVGPLAGRFGAARIMWAGKIGFGVIALLIPAANGNASAAMVAIGLFCLSAAFVTYNVLQVSYRQLAFPSGLMGRVNATVRWIQRGTIPLGALCVAILSQWISLRAITLIGVVGAAASVAWIFGEPLRVINQSALQTARHSKSSTGTRGQTNAGSQTCSGGK